MLMTPWLAAGAGVVVAAALALHVPHAELTYTPNAPGACSLAECGTIAGGTVGPAQPAGQGHAAELRQRKKDPATRRHRAAGRPPAGRLRVRYETLRAGPSGFTGLITLSGRAVQGSWQLTFRYPGARVLTVDGAAWTVRDGVVIITGPGNGAAGRTAAITLQASGAPASPIQCTFDGVACTVR
ncbi:MAG TPA: hypothetical protein VGQ05_15045 [Streptosporangiaceae bacterium]|jgi:hypothetical protein|nr:hypothetical protein [Streptosporangiaceae bacterium]